eukprot:TRINITY_DN63856_c0_g1_i1.p1 TRINITY_DN63856_c0_g1~~TRINITY_DN63856_c0_g1_i1.p1  ORF type:complete len:354 (-),score=61.61 TRINITY_DN63856_c0_g1_i1:62-1123(-)
MDGAGPLSDAPPPPVGGLGNYKGVMLCNRPADGPSRAQNPEGASVPPFRSTISGTYREQLGLQPCKQADGPVVEVKTRGPSAALRRHVRWIKDLQDQVRDDQRRVEMEENGQEARKESMQEVFKCQRDAIRQMRMEGEPLDRKQLEAVMKQYPPTGSRVAPRQKVSRSKPVWAMTEQEKDDFDEEEAADLINFAEGLDYEQFVGDQEFRNRLKAVQHRARRIEKEQEAFKESILREFDGGSAAGDAHSSPRGPESGLDGSGLFGDVASSSRRRRRHYDDEGSSRGVDNRKEWDNSTVGDEDGRYAESEGGRSMAEHVLLNNPQLAGIHSKGSVQRLIEKARSEAATSISGSSM